MRNPFTMMPDWDFHRAPHKPSQSTGTQQVVNKTELPGWVSDAGQRNLNQAYQVSQNLMAPFGGQRVTDMTPGQMADIQGLQSLPGMAQPAFGLAQGIAADVGNYNPTNVSPSFLAGMDLSSYMNPFTQSVIGTGLAGLDVQRQQALRQVGDQALQARAFGGSRQGITEGITNAGAAMQAGQLASQLGFQNFQQAQQAATGDITRDLQAQQFNEQMRQQARQLNLYGANALGSLAGQGQQAQLQALMAALQGQGLVQQQNQAQLDAARQYYQEQQQFPVQQLQIPLTALGMTPYGQTQTQTSPTPPSNAAMSTLGGIASGVGILGSLFAPAGGGGLLAGLFGSDKKLKTDIVPIGHHDVLDLPTYAFRYKGDPKTYPKTVGFMAQDVEKSYPQAVHDVGGVKAVDYGFLGDVANLNSFYRRAA